MRLHIPSNHRGALQAFVKLSESDRTTLAVTLANMHGHISPTSIQQEIAALPAIGVEAGSLVDALIAARAVAFAGSPVAEVAAAIVTEIDFDDAPNADELVRSLTAVIETEAVFVATKVVDLAVADERTFASARVVTQYRPMFGDDPTEGHVGGVLVHDLEIRYFGPRGPDSFFVALDDTDLERIARVIERARGKATSLMSTLAAAGLTVHTAEPSDDASD